MIAKQGEVGEYTQKNLDKLNNVFKNVPLEQQEISSLVYLAGEELSTINI